MLQGVTYCALVENVTPTLDVRCLTLHTGFEACCLNPYVPICSSGRRMDLSRPADMSVFRAEIINYGAKYLCI